jgi:lysophospholipase L1-like esterase
VGDPAASRLRRGLKLVLFSLTPLLLLLAAAELGLRLAGLDGPREAGPGLVEEQFGITRQDPDLFWSLRPGLARSYRGALVRTNRLGLRGPEVGEKAPGERRILLLGESTTFGFGVGQDETYAARLQAQLDGEPGRYSVVNAGVPAWTLFQSTVWLRERGLALAPDAVAIYHLVNDFLPTSYRASAHGELGSGRSDAELHAFYRSLWIDRLIRYSAIFRAGSHAYARWLGTRARDAIAADAGREQILWTPAHFPHDQPVRVRPEERRALLETLLALSREHDFELVIMHPVYRDVPGHDELLLAFSREHDLAFVDGPAVFDASGVPRGLLFSDALHPVPRGHRLLARALYATLRDRGVLREGPERP